MSYYSFNKSFSKQDSIDNSTFKDDTILQNKEIIPPQSAATSINQSEHSFSFKDTLSVQNNQTYIKQEKPISPIELLVSSDTTIIAIIEKDSTQPIKEPHNFFSFSIVSDSFDHKYDVVYSENKDKNDWHRKELNYITHHYHRSQLNWTLILGLLSIVLLLSIKTYYRKFLQQVINTLFNFQLANKMFKEKNILIRRAFFFLNLNFVIILSLFILLISITFEFHITNKNFLDYLIILSIVITVLLLRYIIFYLSGILFLQLPVILEYLHNKYLYNKNIGIALIPIIFTSIYVSPSISKVLLISSAVFIILLTVFKIFRGFQIFLKNGMLFYTILYLCTLELLPLVLGSKIISSLR